MAVYTGIYAVYERLASAKMNSMVSAINSHTHDGTYGIKVNFSNLEGSLAVGQLPAGTFITAGMLSNNIISTGHIVDGTIRWEDLDSASILINNDKYALYAP